MPNVKQVHDGGIYRTKVLDDQSTFLSRAWTQFMQALDVFRQNAPSYFFTTHAIRLTTNPTQVNIGTIFFETDTSHTFISDGTIWRQIA